MAERIRMMDEKEMEQVSGGAYTGSVFVYTVQDGKTIIIVTHNQNIAKMADVIIHIRSGKVTSVDEQSHPLSAEEVEW